MEHKEMMKKLGFTTLTPIQEGVFSHFHHPKHLVGLAPTGTGKTHAYLLPILEKLNPEDDFVQTIILVPTNELVFQVQAMLKQTDDRFVVKAYSRDQDKQAELAWLENRQPQIVITTPNRLKLFTVETQALKIHQTKYFVLDEADMMFDEEFLGWIDEIMTMLKTPKILLFSATMTRQMEPFISQYFGQHDFLDTTQDHDLNIDYWLFNIKNQNRLEYLMKIVPLLQPYLAFIFVSKRENQDVVYERLLEAGLNVLNFKSSYPVSRRRQLLAEIKALKYQYVVTSDVTSRGLDFKLSHVIHYDLPYHLEYFFHRSGRTGRMGDHGVVITFMSVDDHRKIERLRKQINFQTMEIKNQRFVQVDERKKSLSEEEIAAIRFIRKPKKVKPNYKKKYRKEVEKARKQAKRRTYYDQNR